MANEKRVRGNLVAGTLTAALTNVATSMSSAGLANLPVVDATSHAAVVIENEIVYVTAHTAGATTATISRGQDGTTAAAHNSGVAWVHGPVVSDMDVVLGRTPVTANQGSITTQTDLTGATVTVTVPYTQHLIRISAKAYPTSTAAGDTVTLFIMEGATVLDQAQAPLPVAGQGTSIIAAALTVPTAAAHTYKLQMARQSGSGTVTNNASASFPTYILVEDMGPSV